MKKYSYIVLVVLAVVVASCQKEVVTPTGSSTINRPNWESDANSKGSSSTDKSLDLDGTIIIGTGSSNDGSITDPNKDPDANKQKGGRGKK